ncbi:MAG TPA: hypothetical protein VMP10_01170 [Chloroflexota bacterium]|nr:hypothetical protein [Chloroflexota bacterium]
MRERLRSDKFFFMMVLLTLWIANVLFALTWYFFRDPLMIVAAGICIGLVVWLFKIRNQ